MPHSMLSLSLHHLLRTTTENRLISPHPVFVTISSTPTFYGKSHKLNDDSNGNDAPNDNTVFQAYA